MFLRNSRRYSNPFWSTNRNTKLQQDPSLDECFEITVLNIIIMVVILT